MKKENLEGHVKVSKCENAEKSIIAKYKTSDLNLNMEMKVKLSNLEIVDFLENLEILIEKYFL